MSKENRYADPLPSKDLTSWELEILQEIASGVPKKPWGAAVGEAYEFLRSSGYLTNDNELTPKAQSYLEKEKMREQDPTKLIAAAVRTPSGGLEEVKNPSVADRLTRLAALRRKKQAEYGDHFEQVGQVLKAFFPKGVTLRTAHDLGRFKNLTQAIDKLHRYAVNFENGGHEDSLDDLAVYAQIQAHLDALARKS